VGDSQTREISGFGDCNALSRIEIPPSVEMIAASAFLGCSGLTEVTFVGDSHITEIHGFRDCTSLSRIEIPSSVQIIVDGAFFGCLGLTEVTFVGDSHAREIDGFERCNSLSRIEIPASVEVVRRMFFGRVSPVTLILKSGTQIKRIGWGNSRTRAFVLFEDQNDMTQCRRRIHLCGQS
jgi:hypothetical protein